MMMMIILGEDNQNYNEQKCDDDDELGMIQSI